MAVNPPPGSPAAIRQTGRNKSWRRATTSHMVSHSNKEPPSGGRVGLLSGVGTSSTENMEITKALWQLFYAILIFAAYVLCMVFVAPFGFGLAAFASAWTSFREGSFLPAAIAVFTGILMELLAVGIWIAIASWIFGNPDQYR